MTSGEGFPLTSHLRLSPSFTRSLVGQVICGPTEKEKSQVEVEDKAFDKSYMRCKEREEE